MSVLAQISLQFLPRAGQKSRISHPQSNAHRHQRAQRKMETFSCAAAVHCTLRTLTFRLAGIKVFRDT
eukprot:12035914-Karenia_brevis.AAC.1